MARCGRGLYIGVGLAFERHSENVQMVDEVRVLAVGWEGGAAIVFGRKVDDKTWRFRMEGSSTAFDDNDEETTTEFGADNLDSWYAALATLQFDEHWFHLVPEYVHPEFEEKVQQTIDDLFKREEERWNSVQRGRKTYWNPEFIRRNR